MEAERTTIMAESGILQCEPCLHENVTNSASKWCTDCQESLCNDCCRRHKAHKMSKNHHVISSDEYQKIEKININLECLNHCRKFDFYCPIHDSVVCVECVQLQHGGCKDIKPLDEAAKDAKTSYLLTDLEQTIDGLLDNIVKGVQHLEQNKTDLQEQEEVTKKSIAKTRADINKRLDRLEEKLLQELKSKSEKAITELFLITTKFETKRKNISALKDTAENMKQFSSNLQLFVGIRSILKSVSSEMNGVKLLLSSIPQLTMAVQINPKFDTLTEGYSSLGEIHITSKKAVVPFVDRRLKQAQYLRPAEPPVQTLHNAQDFKLNKACKPEEDILMVAAIDFGTTYSGYAFSARHSFEINKLDISENQAWNAGSRQLLSLKTPTCILLKRNKEFVSFGYEAENAYADIIMDHKEDDYFFFQQFKMTLYNRKEYISKMVVRDVQGNSLPAIDVFSASIKALRDHLHEALQCRGLDIRHNEIKWVLTVPAIWSEQGKQFMRESAKKAGIRDDRLVIALEPEVASIYCQCLPVERMQGYQEGFQYTQRGTKYMVVDLGGVTVDITAYEKLGENKIVELCKSTGDDCGGAAVDKEFLQIFYDIVGRNCIDEMRSENVESYLELLRSFESKKRNLHSDKRSKINITIPYDTIDGLCKTHHRVDFSTALSESKYADVITLVSDKLFFSSEFLKSLFKKTIDKIIDLIKRILGNSSATGISTILLIGGFAEYPLVREAIRNNFEDKIVLSPDEPTLAVMKGAVIFGHMANFR